MRKWRFIDDEADGEAWLESPELMIACVEYDLGSGSERRRLMVVTKSWIANELNDVRMSGNEPLWKILPTMMVLPDGRGNELRSILNSAMLADGLDLYSTPV